MSFIVSASRRSAASVIHGIKTPRYQMPIIVRYGSVKPLRLGSGRCTFSTSRPTRKQEDRHPTPRYQSSEELISELEELEAEMLKARNTIKEPRRLERKIGLLLAERAFVEAVDKWAVTDTRRDFLAAIPALWRYVWMCSRIPRRERKDGKLLRASIYLSIAVMRSLVVIALLLLVRAFTNPAMEYRAPDGSVAGCSTKQVGIQPESRSRTEPDDTQDMMIKGLPTARGILF